MSNHYSAEIPDTVDYEYRLDTVEKNGIAYSCTANDKPRYAPPIQHV